MTRLAFAVVLALSAAPAPAQPADPLPTHADIRQSFDAGDYPRALQKLTRVLTLRGKAAEPYDRHALLVLQGETHLRMRAGTLAGKAFAEAAKEAKDGPAAAADVAAELLVKRSSVGLAYQPKAKDPADKTKALPAIDIVDPASRKRAVAALFADEWAATEPRVRAAKQARTLPPILEALPTIRTLRWLELAAVGGDNKTRELIGPLPDTAKKLLDASVKEMDESADAIRVMAMDVTTARVPVNDRQTGKVIRIDTKYRYRGPTPRQFATLKEALSTCGKIYKSCDELGGTLGSTGKEFEGTKSAAETLGTKVKAMLDTNWETRFDAPPPAAPRPVQK